MAQERVDAITASSEAQEKVVAELQRRDKELERGFRESLKEVAQAPLEPDVVKLLTTLFKRRWVGVRMYGGVCVCVGVRMCGGVCMGGWVYVWVRLGVYVCVGVHICMGEAVRVCICWGVHMGVRICMDEVVRVCVWVGEVVWVCECGLVVGVLGFFHGGPDCGLVMVLLPGAGTREVVPRRTQTPPSPGALVVLQGAVCLLPPRHPVHAPRSLLLFSTPHALLLPPPYHFLPRPSTT